MAQTADDGHPANIPSGLRADVCPVCGGPNECGGAKGEDRRFRLPAWSARHSRSANFSAFVTPAARMAAESRREATRFRGLRLGLDVLIGHVV
jgi:hypothetical protein